MKKLICLVLFIFSIIPLAACSPSNEPISYSLDWKLDDNEVIAYKTAMNLVDDAETTVSFDWGQFLGEDIDYGEFNQELSKLTTPEISSFISILKPNEQGNISVQMIVGEVNSVENSESSALNDALNNMMQSMEGTVQLRGEITPAGAIDSFYLEPRQKNLLAIFFELPTYPVKVGDTWQLDFNCLSMGAGFIAEHSEKTNQVEFVYVSKTADDEVVAVLDYMMLEYVEGTFKNPLSEDVTPTSMTCGFLGRGQFLIEQGRWEQFVGEFMISSMGLMTTDNTQEFALTPLNEIPEEYLNMK